MNLTPEKDLARELREIDKLRGQARHDAVHVAWKNGSVVGCLLSAEASTVSDFRHYVLKLPSFALPILRKRIAMPANPQAFSTSKLKVLDAAIRKAQTSLACPRCSLRLPAKGLHLHMCRGKSLSALEMATAKLKAGIPVGARLAKSLAGGAA